MAIISMDKDGVAALALKSFMVGVPPGEITTLAQTSYPSPTYPIDTFPYTSFFVFID